MTVPRRGLTSPVLCGHTGPMDFDAFFDLQCLAGHAAPVAAGMFVHAAIQACVQEQHR